MILAIMLILPISALATRRMPLAQLARYAAAWLTIFLVGLLIASLFT